MTNPFASKVYQGYDVSSNDGNSNLYSYHTSMNNKPG
jgi:hypothetical protein